VRRHTTKKGEEMAFVTLEDLQGVCDVVVFPQTWSKTKDLWQPERILVVAGKVDATRRDTASLLCDWAKTLDEVDATHPMVIPAQAGELQVGGPGPAPSPSSPAPVHTIRVTLTRSGQQAEDVQALRTVHSLLIGHPGSDRFTIRLVGGTSRPIELAFPNDTTRYDAELARQLKAMLGPDALHVESGTQA
jgi:DNA polymerase-3 subunit alpha